MTAGNPFDPTQYQLSLSVNSEYDPTGTGGEGVKELLSYIRDQVRLRQEAVAIGYLSAAGAVSELLPLNGTAPDTTGAMLAVMESCRDCVLQLMEGHPSTLWERYGAVPCDPTNPSSILVVPVGFFRTPSVPSDAAEPTDTWVRTLAALVEAGLLADSDRLSFINPPRFGDGYISLRAYASAIGSWGTSTFRDVCSAAVHPVCVGGKRMHVWHELHERHAWRLGADKAD
jgi:hypothetical protein